MILTPVLATEASCSGDENTDVMPLTLSMATRLQACTCGSRATCCYEICRRNAQDMLRVETGVHIRADWTTSYSLSVPVDGCLGNGDRFSDFMATDGAVLCSSQWAGWVPGYCSGDGDLAASSFTVSSLGIQGSVVQGPEHTKRSSLCFHWKGDAGRWRVLDADGGCKSVGVVSFKQPV